jgi:cell pole-organizing protein PopZ
MMHDLSIIKEIVEHLESIRRIIEDDESGFLSVVDVYADQMKDELQNLIDENECDEYEDDD